MWRRVRSEYPSSGITLAYVQALWKMYKEKDIFEETGRFCRLVPVVQSSPISPRNVCIIVKNSVRIIDKFYTQRAIRIARYCSHRFRSRRRGRPRVYKLIQTKRTTIDDV